MDGTTADTNITCHTGFTACAGFCGWTDEILRTSALSVWPSAASLKHHVTVVLPCWKAPLFPFPARCLCWHSSRLVVKLRLSQTNNCRLGLLHLSIAGGSLPQSSYFFRHFHFSFTTVRLLFSPLIVQDMVSSLILMQLAATVPPYCKENQDSPCRISPAVFDCYVL